MFRLQKQNEMLESRTPQTIEPQCMALYISAILSLDPVFQINNNLSMSNTLLANFKQAKTRKLYSRERISTATVSPFRHFVKNIRAILWL